MDGSERSQLAGVIELSVQTRVGPRTAFVFDPHRLALPCWFAALGRTRGALLITLDRHCDLVPPQAPAPVEPNLQAVDTYARWELDRRNVDHILAAMELGLISDAWVIARARPKGIVEGSSWTDRHGKTHRFVVAPSLEAVLDWMEQGSANPVGESAQKLLSEALDIVLDVDLDCFTTPSDVDPTTPVPWPKEHIESFLLPGDAEHFWHDVLKKTRAITLAREPAHCGGLVATGALFQCFAEVFFVELLGADLP